MPVVFREQGVRFHFYSNEGDPREPAHIHAVKADADAKLWLYPEVSFAYNRGFDARTQRWLLALVEERQSDIEDAWNAHFS
ncbi:DUF4160 domain-containing protein [Sphingomonas abietis]|uniref:DUF4160 domain-containing protein n=1 Tax=Sphingomonas abietis TaxID=3012344 RepID=A0ABY7NSZ3_9SPHN|nr:DUF4160 domain-containing protein [Sphingomonas abietis]WBO23069.1 DUF4160 domain-containing protein [Sphingomonas abietis]